MKKIQELVKPFLCIILGALILFYYLNFLSLDGTGLAVGIVAVIIASYYIAIGVLNVTMGDKLPRELKNYFNLFAVVMFPLFVFTSALLTLIGAAQVEGALGPNGWVILLISIIASISFASLYIVQNFVKVSVIRRIALLFASIFVLALLIDVLFTLRGDAVVLGEIDVVYLLIDVFYVYILLDAVMAMQKRVLKVEEPEEDAPEAEPEEEPQEEPETKEAEEKPEEEKGE